MVNENVYLCSFNQKRGKKAKWDIWTSVHIAKSQGFFIHDTF